MALTDLREALDPALLKLPIGGKDYVVRPCTGAVWLRLQEINERATERVTAGDEGAQLEDLDVSISQSEMFQLALGDTYDELMREVTMAEVQHAGITAYYWQLGNEEVAIQVWESAGKARTPAPAAPRRRASSASPRVKRSTASPTTTTSRKR